MNILKILGFEDESLLKDFVDTRNKECNNGLLKNFRFVHKNVLYEYCVCGYMSKKYKVTISKNLFYLC